jgi:NAD-dependent dihydropyrimidine dehydrogenase PreA subunit
MPFDFDPFEEAVPALPGLDRIDTHEDGRGRDQKRVAIRIDYDLCDETAACAMVCPEEVIEIANGHSTIVKPEACTECWICVENCPSGAIEIT